MLRDRHAPYLLEMKNDTSRKSTRGQRLLKIVECPELQGARATPRVSRFARHEDGNVRCPEVALEIPEEIPTIQTADLGIDDHEVGPKLGRVCDDPCRGGECSAIEAEQSERRGPGSLDYVVIEDQHERPFANGSSHDLLSSFSMSRSLEPPRTQ